MTHKYSSIIKSTPEAKAQDALLQWWFPDEFPVNPITIAERFGLLVVVEKLPDEVSGA